MMISSGRVRFQPGQGKVTGQKRPRGLTLRDFVTLGRTIMFISHLYLAMDPVSDMLISLIRGFVAVKLLQRLNN